MLMFLNETLGFVLKLLVAVVALVLVWLAGGEYQRDHFRVDYDREIAIRVRKECLRPDWVVTLTGAQEFDLVNHEMNLLDDKISLLNRRTESLLDQTEKVEALRQAIVMNHKHSSGGIGGPAPTPKH